MWTQRSATKILSVSDFFLNFQAAHSISLPFLGLHQSSINPDKGDEEWQERTAFVILFQH